MDSLTMILGLLALVSFYAIGVAIQAVSLTEETNVVRLWGRALLWPAAAFQRLTKDCEELTEVPSPPCSRLADYAREAQDKKREASSSSGTPTEPRHAPHKWME